MPFRAARASVNAPVGACGPEITASGNRGYCNEITTPAAESGAAADGCHERNVARAKAGLAPSRLIWSSPAPDSPRKRRRHANVVDQQLHRVGGRCGSGKHLAGRDCRTGGSEPGAVQLDDIARFRGDGCISERRSRRAEDVIEPPA